MKFFIIGHGRHGKTEAAEFINKITGLTFADSSKFAAKVVRPYLEQVHFITYPSLAACWQDRHNHRSKWYEAITQYNSHDMSRLSQAIFEECDIYAGIRNREEFIASKHLSDLAVWIDASDRCGLEPESSMTIRREDADIVVENNDTLLRFHQKLARLMGSLGVLRPGPVIATETVHGVKDRAWLKR